MKQQDRIFIQLLNFTNRLLFLDAVRPLSSDNISNIGVQMRTLCSNTQVTKLVFQLCVFNLSSVSVLAEFSDFGQLIQFCKSHNLELSIDTKTFIRYFGYGKD